MKKTFEIIYPAEWGELTSEIVQEMVEALTIKNRVFVEEIPNRPVVKETLKEWQRRMPNV